MRSSVPEYKRPPLVVKVIVGYSVLVGFSMLSLTFADSPLYLGISILAFAAAVGLWREQDWGIAAGILLYLFELGRNTLAVLAVGGEVSSVITAALSLLVVVYLTRRRYYGRIR